MLPDTRNKPWLWLLVCPSSIGRLATLNYRQPGNLTVLPNFAGL